MRSIVLAVAALAMIGTAAVTFADHHEKWKAKEVRVVDGFETPECVIEPTGAHPGFVSNIVTGGDRDGGGGPWDTDAMGHLSTLTRSGRVAESEWASSHEAGALDGPKGMCVLGGAVWVTDNSGVARFPLDGGEGAFLPVEGAKKLNDMASDGEHAYATDTGGGKIYKLSANGVEGTVPSPPAPNGITFAEDGTMYAVSWGKHEIYEVDPSGGDEPEALGVADHFESLDGIEVLPDGKLLVSDFVGGAVKVVDPDKKIVRTLIEMNSPADIGWDAQRKRLYVPSFKGGTVRIYELSK